MGRDRVLVGTPILYNRRFPSLLLDEKGRKDQGQHQGPTALGRCPSPMSAVARAPYPACFWRHRVVGNTDALRRVIARNEAIQRIRYTTSLSPHGVIAGSPPRRGCPKGKGSSPRSHPFLIHPFSLMRRDRRIKADIIGPPRKAGASPPCRPFLPALPGEGWAFPVCRSLSLSKGWRAFLPMSSLRGLCVSLGSMGRKTAGTMAADQSQPSSSSFPM